MQVIIVKCQLIKCIDLIRKSWLVVGLALLSVVYKRQMEWVLVTLSLDCTSN